jgi:hypothetical protein
VDRKLAEFQAEKGLEEVSQSYKHYGVHRVGDKYIYQEWAPDVQGISIFG